MPPDVRLLLAVLLSCCALLSLAVAYLGGSLRALRADLEALRRSLALLDGRVTKANGALTVEVRRLDQVEQELSEHLEDPIGALRRPVRV